MAYPYIKFDYCSFNRNRDMVSALQNLNRSRDLTMPLSWMICGQCARTCYGQLPTECEVSISIHYEDMKRDTKCRKSGGFG